MDDPRFSVNDIVELRGFGRAALAWIAARSIPAHSLGRLWKFRKDGFDSWVR